MYNFTFANVGGSTRVKIHCADDIRHLGELDKKMWTVLSCPVSGLEIDESVLNIMDYDGNGHLRIPEIINTAQWLCNTLVDPSTLFLRTDSIEAANIQDEALRTLAERLDTVSIASLDAAVASTTIPEVAVPDAPYAAEVIDAYDKCKDAYNAYFKELKLQQLGLATIPAETPVPGISEQEFTKMGEAIASWRAAKTAAEAQVSDAKAAAVAEWEPLRKLLLLHRDFVKLLHNFVTFEDFYRYNADAIFQAGTLVIDQRACHLCLRVSDMAKQDAQAGQSSMFLVFCDCTKEGMNKMQIVAAVTMGEIRNLTVGKNAIFYDRQGRDWNATIIKVIDNPISIRQAFWSPYRKFGNWITELINKSASEKNDKVLEDMKTKTQAETQALATAQPDAKPEEKKPAFDIAKFAGIFAAIGIAIGYIGSFFASLASGISSLAWWQLLIWIAGLLLVISGPSMILAWMRMRRRNLSPILNANGWAVNSDAIISLPFGATLTEQAQFPLLKLSDPFKKEGLSREQKIAIAAAILIGAVAIAMLILYLCGIVTF